MSFGETVEAILATDMPLDNKQAAIRKAKADAHALAAPKAGERIEVAGVELLFRSTPSVNFRGVLCLDFTSEDIELDTPLYVLNPPVLVKDSEGDLLINGVRHREDVTAALLEVLTEFVEETRPKGA